MGRALTAWLWSSAYNAGWGANDAAGYISKQICTSLVNVRQQLALAKNHAAFNEMQRQITGRGRPTPKPAKP